MRTLAIILLGVALASCGKEQPETAPPANPPASPGAGAPPPAPDAAVARTGVLSSGIVAIGGETTGWELKTADGTIEVDVSGCLDDAAKLDGKNVTVRGTMTTKKYVERGEVQVLVATSIDPA